MSNPITQPPVPFILNPNEPSLADALATTKKELLLGLNCVHVATIQTFNATNQTATAQVNYTKNYFVHNPATNQYVPTAVPYPLLVDCPVVCLGGGGGAITFPVTTGDECLVLFNDRDITNWFANTGTALPPITARLHSFSDGLIIVGIRSLQNALTAYDTSRPMIRGNKAGTTYVAVGASTIEITNATGVNSLGIILSNLMMALTTFNTALGTAAAAFATNPTIETAAAAGGADLAAAALALQTAVTAIQTLITGLLV